MSWQPVIGLEIHVQLATASKIFSGAPTAFGAEPNRQACAVDLGLPGVLPVINARAVSMAVLFGLAIEGEIARHSIFARKNYFYPDLPKGYQISQFDDPIVAHGRLNISCADGSEKWIRIRRAHLEEDAGKSIHDAFPGSTGLDLNRAGTPLLEVVSEPDLASATEAVQYMRILHTLVKFLGICDGNMQEGSFRCDANVSVRRPGAPLGTRAEIKNLNSFRFIEKAINYEIARQIDVLESGGTVVQETRLYDAERDETRSMRSKEDAHDYRYFPDPDLLPLVVTDAEIESARAALPELPQRRQTRYRDEYKLSEEDAEALSSERAVADYFESLSKLIDDPKQAANWIVGEVFAALNRDALPFTAVKLAPEALAALINRVRDKTISNTIAKQVFDAMWHGGGGADAIIDAQGLRQVSNNDEIEVLIDDVIAESPEQLAQFRAGKDKVFSYFVGNVMKKSRGKANPQLVNEILQRKLREP